MSIVTLLSNTTKILKVLNNKIMIRPLLGVMLRSLLVICKLLKLEKYQGLYNKETYKYGFARCSPWNNLSYNCPGAIENVCFLSMDPHLLYSKKSHHLIVKAFVSGKEF